MQETGVLAGLAFLNASLGIGLRDGGLEAALFSGHEQQTNVCSCGPSDHVLDVIFVARGVDNRVVILVCEELLCVALDGHPSLALLLARVKVVRKAERRLSLFLGHCLEFVHLSLGDATLLEDKVTTCGGLSCIDVTTDNN